jgi:hypothetical protein
VRVEACFRAAILVLAVISLIRGDELWAAAGFVSLFLTFLPTIIRREFGVSIGVELEILIMISLLLHILGGVFELYTKYDWDYVTHFVSSMLIATLGLTAIYTIDRYTDSIELSPAALAFLTVVFTIAAGVLWELGEFASDSFFGTFEQRGYLDTMHDLAVDAIGGVCVAILAPSYVRRGRVERLIDIETDVPSIKRPNLHWLIPCVMGLFIAYSLVRRDTVSLFVSLSLFILSFFHRIRKTSLAVEALFFIAFLLKVLDDTAGFGYSYPGIVVMISFIFSYVLDSLYGPSPWFLSFLVPVTSLFVAAVLEIVRFFSGPYMPNRTLMMNFIYVAAFSVPAGVVGWAFYDYMDVTEEK